MGKASASAQQGTKRLEIGGAPFHKRRYSAGVIYSGSDEDETQQVGTGERGKSSNSKATLGL